MDTASLQDGAVSSSKITAEAVLSMHLAPRAVTATTITAGAIEATHITDAAVTSPKVQLSYDSIRASQNLSLNLTPAVITGTASTFTPPTTQILYGSHFATLVCPSCTCWCQMYVDSVAYGAKSAASSTTGSVTVSASFTATVTAGLHIVDLRCWSSSATCGTVQATPASMDTGYQYILFSQ